MTVPTNAIELQKRKKAISVAKEAASSKPVCGFSWLVLVCVWVTDLYSENKTNPKKIMCWKSNTNTNIILPSGNEKENERGKRRFPMNYCIYAYLMMNSMLQLEFWMAARGSLDEVFCDLIMAFHQS